MTIGGESQIRYNFAIPTNCENDDMSGLTQNRLKELLDYDPVTGVFRWRVDRYRVQRGDFAGCVDSHGRNVIRLMQRNYRAYRLAWLWMTGSWPTDEIDHRDLNSSNDAWSNLRQATGSQNKANRAPKGQWPKGVSRHVSGKFFARASKDGRVVCCGYFRTPEEAHAAYCRVAADLHGEFARSA